MILAGPKAYRETNLAQKKTLIIINGNERSDYPAFCRRRQCQRARVSKVKLGTEREGEDIKLISAPAALDLFLVNIIYIIGSYGYVVSIPKIT
ncbi:hypothetical protein CHL76_05290 [Marinococcus halophilus]|uniref:Uncharacterized protein n=1 Tax=Marinococcus halophilus TaxID=1371 RepID=A0A510Y3A5_MARHA|nr:hypothetical protein CHL76_05290 [Marinococcus halophilus]GEK57794.1 hypothetical protein MHA01_06990 [Marinococcus halophilus]